MKLWVVRTIGESASGRGSVNSPSSIDVSHVRVVAVLSDADGRPAAKLALERARVPNRTPSNAHIASRSSSLANLPRPNKDFSPLAFCVDGS